jgi:dipeptidyl aminopeptidase/acylaminoacyl peptidase
MIRLFLSLGLAGVLFGTPALPAVAQSAKAGPAIAQPFPAGLTGTLAFQSDRPAPDNPDGRSHIFTIDLATGSIRQLTSGRNHHDSDARWSPDGTKIAFKSTRSGNWDLYVMGADGTNVTRITEHPAADHDPRWMPDMQSLIFSSERDSRSDLYRVWLKDRRVDRLTNHFVGRAIMPNVSADGRSVAFAAQTLQRLQFWEFQVHVLDLATEGPKPELVRDLGATYHATTLREFDPPPDIIIEATGVSQVVLDAMSHTGANGIVCLTGISGGYHVTFDAGMLNRSIVLENDLVFGSVNANRRHYEAAAEALADADRSWLERLIPRRVPLDRWREALTREEHDIKVVVELGG